MTDEANLFNRWKRDAVIAGTAGVVSTIMIGIVTVVMGHVGDAEARRLLESMIPTSRLLCSTLLTVSATILALMMTLIGLGSNSELKLADAHYHRIMKIALYDAILFSLAAILFVAHCVPVYDSDSLPGWWYPSIYYGVLLASAVLAGGAIAIIVMLYLAVKDMVEIFGLEVTDHRLAKERESAADDNSTNSGGASQRNEK